MPDLQSAILQWQKTLGFEYVKTDSTTLETVQTATFKTDQEVLGVIFPLNREEVQKCVEIANKYKIRIYPISTGKNWGYGSKVPVKNNCVVMDLSRLNQIVDYNEEMAYVVLQPGVTQRKLFEFLREKNSNLFMSTTGSSPDSSLIGNILERGLGEGPYGDRFEHVCCFEVVLPTGESIQTGFGQFSNAHSRHTSRWGLGPYLDGLFTQSNLGIVTQMTMWLTPKPKNLQIFWFVLKNHGCLKDMVTALRDLKLMGVVRGAFVVANDARMLSYRQQYPWKASNEKVPLSKELQDNLVEKWKDGVWNGEGAIYAASKEHGDAIRKIIEARLSNVVSKIFFMDENIAQKPRQELEQLFPDANINELLKWYNENLKRGIPTELALTMIYWRKKTPYPIPGMHPDRDNCGVLWFSPSVPFCGNHICKVVKIMEDVFKRHPFEPSIGLNCVTERNINVIASIIYDRDVEGEDEKALKCYTELKEEIMKQGYMPYRTSIKSMDSLPELDKNYCNVINRLKKVLDPNNILSPGRYDFRDDL